MSSMRLLLLAIFLVSRSHSIGNLFYQIQPQSVRINNLDEIYITSDDHYIGRVLYQYDLIELACECQTQLKHIQFNIYWTINNKTFNRYNNSDSIQLVINIDSVQVPITYVTCHCVFVQSNLRKIKRSYQYLLYIDLESEPSLKPIKYSVQSSIIKQHFYDFLHRHFIVILSFILMIIGITCPLIILSFVPSHITE